LPASDQAKFISSFHLENIINQDMQTTGYDLELCAGNRHLGSLFTDSTYTYIHECMQYKWHGAECGALYFFKLDSGGVSVMSGEYDLIVSTG
jgi:hypothetical protein